MRTVKIAFVAPMTGDQSIVAIPMLKVVEMAVENLKLSNIHVNVIGFDDLAEPEEAVKVAREIANDQDIIAVVGNKNSVTLEAAGSVYEKNSLSFITTSATNYSLSQKGWKGFFRLCANDKVQAQVAAKFAYDDLKLRNLCMVHDETSYGLPLGHEFKRFAVKLGAKVDMVKLIPCGTKDVKKIVNDIKKSGVEGVYFALTEIESSVMAREMLAQNAPQIILGTDGSSGSKFPELAGDAAEGAYMTYAAGFPGKTRKGRELLSQYEVRHGTYPVYTLETFDAVGLIMKVLRDDDSVQREQISMRIRQTTPWEGASGIIDFHESGNRKNQEVSIWQVKNGEMKYLKSLRDGLIKSLKMTSD